MAQNWFRCFKEDDSSLEEKSRPGTPRAAEKEACLEMLNDNQSQALLHRRQKLVLWKLQSVHTSISSAMWIDAEIFWIRNMK